MADIQTTLSLFAPFVFVFVGRIYRFFFSFDFKDLPNFFLVREVWTSRMDVTRSGGLGAFSTVSSFVFGVRFWRA